MKIKATKTFAAWINSVANRTGKQFHAELKEYSLKAYSAAGFSLSNFNIFDAADYGDWDAERSVVRIIEVRYPYEFHAVPQYLTTKTLVKEFRTRGVKTENDLEKMIIDLCEI